MSRRGASNWPDNTASQNMFLNIFFVDHSSTAAAEHGSDFRNSGERSVTFLSVEWTPSRPKRSAYMLRKTMIALAKPTARTSGLTVEAFAHGGGRGHGGGFGGGGHMSGFGGARIGSGFGSGFAGSHFGAALGLALFGLV